MSSTVPSGANCTSPVVRLQVLRVEEGASWFVRSLVSDYGGVRTHWKGGRSLLCEGEDCRYCKSVPDVVWKGYFSAEVWDAKNRWWLACVMEITEACELDLRGRFTRGSVWRFHREKQTTKKKTPVKATFVEQQEPTKVSLAFDVYAVLRTIYHTERINLNCPNPLPDRQMIAPVPGDAPNGAAPGRSSS
jgi:hypothetical protein